MARTLEVNLDNGESEALALAIQEGIGTVLIDEHDGRAIARKMGLYPIGVLGILLRAKRLGYLDMVSPIIQALQEKAGFYVSRHLILRLLREAGED